jgi:DNA-directed RNA polymerase specialized sigma24 family protein
MVSLEHTDALFSYSMALTRNTYEAEDLVQETYFVPYGQWDGSGKTDELEFIQDLS